MYSWTISVPRPPRCSNDQFRYHFGDYFGANAAQMHQTISFGTSLNPFGPKAAQIGNKFCYHFEPFAFGRLSLATAFISEWVRNKNNGFHFGVDDFSHGFHFVITIHSKWHSIRNGFGITPKGLAERIPPERIRRPSSSARRVRVLTTFRGEVSSPLPLRPGPLNFRPNPLNSTPRAVFLL